MQVPASEFGFIGGSGTHSLRFPEGLEAPGVQVLQRDLCFATPFGESPPFTCFRLEGEDGPRTVLACRMHGWRRGVTRRQASQQVFWVLREAGVRRVLGEGGVGAVNHLLRPRDLVVPHDYLDQSMRRDVELEGRYLLVMRDALCPELRALAVQEAEKAGRFRVFDRGVYAVTDGRHFESPAEVGLLRLAGADLVGQSLAPEVYLAREIGACYAGVYLVVNHAEGVVGPWEHAELEDIFYRESAHLGRILLEVLRRAPRQPGCGCRSLRKETLLKDLYREEDPSRPGRDEGM
ncbi:MAG: MTAP family purine nucleoside phosphorylase [Syntrophomonadaceae bacterium]|nr:MTAP family purine nucleoside phosphorylase [Syntrophomonadaceae bacterium]